MFTRSSRIEEICGHARACDLLKEALYHSGKSYSWLESPINRRKKIQALDKLIGSVQVNSLIEAANSSSVEVYDVEDSSADDAWWKEAVIYNIYLPGFMDSDHDGIGDFGGVVRRLSYLESLGVNTVWLWPVIKAEEFHSRSVLDFKDVNEDFGTMDDFEMLLEAAHGKGIRVLMGFDFLGTSDRHEWYKSAVSDEKSPYGDFYFFKKGTKDKKPNNWKRTTGESVWEWCEENSSWNLRTRSKDKADLNWSNPAMRREITNALQFWTKIGVDGFCFGGINLLAKDNFEDGTGTISELTGATGIERYSYSDEIHGYLRELRAGVSQGLSDKNVPFLCGEVFGVGTEVSKTFTGKSRRELDMVVDTFHLQTSMFGKNEAAELDLFLLKKYYAFWMENFARERWMSVFFEYSETVRIISRIEESPLYRNLIAKLLATIMFTMRGTPMMYQGSELGLINIKFDSVDEFRDENAINLYNSLKEELSEEEAFSRVLQKTRDHTRAPMPWNASENGGFTGADPWIRPIDSYEKKNASVQMNDKVSVWNYYSAIIEMRRSSKALVYGSFNNVFPRNKDVFCYIREYGGEKWYVELNLSNKEVPRPGRIGKRKLLKISSYSSRSRTLRPYEANVYQIIK